MLFLPNRDAGFYFFDDVAASVEGGSSVGCGNADPDGDASDFEQADAVLGDGGVDLEFSKCFSDNALAFFVSESGVGGVLEPIDGLAFVVVANPAFEGGEGSGVGVEQLAFQFFGLKRICRKGEWWMVNGERELSGLAAGDGRDEDDGVSVGEWRFPGGEVVVDGDFQGGCWEGEAVGLVEFLVELVCGGGGAFDGFLVKTALVFEEGEVLDL